MQVQPYLSFEGRCEEAIEFYRQALGAEVAMMSRFGESPDKSMLTPGTEQKIMRATLRIGDSQVMASDGHCRGQANFAGTSLALILKSEQEAKKAFESLSAGGQVQMPLTKTFFSPAFGMLADKFGVPWMIYVPGGPN